MLKRTLILCLAALLALAPAALAEGEIDTSGIAGEADMTDVIDIAPEGAEPVTAERLNEGTYSVAVDVSSAMFKVIGCDLTVKDGTMTAALYMKSEAYSYMFPGSAEEAAQAEKDALVPLQEAEDGQLFFTLPVDALDAGYVCAAFSARKQLWYPRMLVFRADSLPLGAWKSEYLVTAETLGLADGEYACEVRLEGEGRAALLSPAKLTVEGGQCAAEIVFSTKKIDYVIVGGEKYEPVSTENGAAFVVPVAAFGLKLALIADSTAIKPAVEVQYSMTFDADTIAPN